MEILPKYLTEAIDNLKDDNAELRAINAQLIDALSFCLAHPEDELAKNYAHFVLHKSQKEMGKFDE